MKSKLVILTCAALVLTLGLIGCATTKQSSIDVSCNEITKQNHISKELQVVAGDSFTVILCSNPTTGFQWEENAQISNPGVVKQVDQNFISPQSDPPPPPGTAGQHVWTFKATEKGASTIFMEYSRPWDGGEKKAWTFNLTLTVK